MSRIETIQNGSWTKFKSTFIAELFADNPFRRGDYIFRGQACSEWRLEPSFDRCFKDLDRTSKIAVMEELLQFFRRECEGLGISQSILSDDLKTMALGQHYGLPTRLLDWTESPYIASFFAFNDVMSTSVNSRDVAIWALDIRVKNIWSSDSGVKVVDVPPIENIRIRNQGGKFTLSNTPFSCLEEYVEHFDENTVALKRFLIPVTEFNRALADLDAMGINHSRVYPELIGCALAAKLRVMLERNLVCLIH